MNRAKVIGDQEMQKIPNILSIVPSVLVSLKGVIIIINVDKPPSPIINMLKIYFHDHLLETWKKQKDANNVHEYINMRNPILTINIDSG